MYAMDDASLEINFERAKKKSEIINQTAILF